MVPQPADWETVPPSLPAPSLMAVALNDVKNKPTHNISILKIYTRGTQNRVTYHKLDKV